MAFSKCPVKARHAEGFPLKTVFIGLGKRPPSSDGFPVVPTNSSEETPLDLQASPVAPAVPLMGPHPSVSAERSHGANGVNPGVPGLGSDSGVSGFLFSFIHVFIQQFYRVLPADQVSCLVPRMPL